MGNIQYYEHTCLCGCGGQIEIKKWDKKNGIPNYIKGHFWIGKKHTEESIEKIKEKRKLQKSPFYGKKHTEEVRVKQSQIRIGKYVGENSPLKGIKKTEEHRNKISKTRIEKGLAKGENNPMYGIHRFGEKSPNWNKGSSFEPYAPEFNKNLKQQILTRDSYICQCPNCEHKTDILDVHHIDYDKKNNNLENVITICRSCHAKTNGKNNRQYWTEYYKNIMENK